MVILADMGINPRDAYLLTPAETVIILEAHKKRLEREKYWVAWQVAALANIFGAIDPPIQPEDLLGVPKEESPKLDKETMKKEFEKLKKEFSRDGHGC